MEEKNEVKRSIFRQKIYKEIVENEMVWTMIPDTAFSTYKRGYVLKPKTRLELKEVKDYVTNIILPVLAKGDKFFVEETNVIYEVKEAIRTSKENIIYIVQDYVEEMDDKYKFIEDKTLSCFEEEREKDVLSRKIKELVSEKLDLEEKLLTFRKKKFFGFEYYIKK